MNHSNNRVRGFTLIELMIVVAVVALLARIAYPSYAESVRKGKRAQARTALAELMQQQERYMTQNNTYYAFSINAGVTSPAAAKDVFKVFSGDSSGSPAYWLYAQQCPAPSGGSAPAVNECIQVGARPTGSDPQVDELRMTSTGQKDCTGSASTTNFKLCWP